LGVERLDSMLRRHKRIALDTSIFIYQFEENRQYLPLTDRIFGWLEKPGSRAITSTLTMTELLVQPYRESNRQRVSIFYALLSTYPNLEWIAPNLEIADRAAQIRAVYNLKTPDAIQAATSRYASATALITNDPVFERVEALETIVLEKLL